MERQLEAVFVSYALFNKWDGEAMVVGHKCPGLSGCRFQSLCHDAGFLPNGQITDRTLKDIHGRHVDKVSKLAKIARCCAACATVCNHYACTSSTLTPGGAVVTGFHISTHILSKLHLRS